jgi:hypothetical protein
MEIHIVLIVLRKRARGFFSFSPKISDFREKSGEIVKFCWENFQSPSRFSPTKSSLSHFSHHFSLGLSIHP